MNDHEHVWMVAEVIETPRGYESQLGDTIHICAICFVQV